MFRRLLSGHNWLPSQSWRHRSIPDTEQGVVVREDALMLTVGTVLSGSDVMPVGMLGGATGDISMADATLFPLPRS